MCATGWKQWICWGAFLWLFGSALGIAKGGEAGLVGWWTFDEPSGTVAHDSSGNGNDGTLAGAVTWVAGKLDGALDFPGSASAYVTVPDAPSLAITDAITMAAWLNPRATGDYRWFIAKQTYGTNQGWDLTLTPTNGIECGLAMNNAWTYRATTATISNGTWVHVVGQYSPPFMRVYINGKLSEEWNVGTAKINTNSFNLLIGKASHGQPYAGSADDVRIYNRALTVEEIQQAMRGRAPGPATSPVPAKDATDVPRDVTLSWQAGPYAATHDVYLGTTFADVNTASIASPPGILASAGQTATTFTPGRLELGQTYYWRVDEVNKAPDKTVFKGDVWSFTTEPVGYLLARTSITATASSVNSADMGPEKTIDGSGLSASGQHSIDPTTMWLSSKAGPQPAWIQYAFDKTYKLDQMQVWNSNQLLEPTLGFGAKSVTVEYSSDGTQWIALPESEFAQAPGMATYAAPTTVNFGGTVAKYVKLTINSNWGGLLPQYGLSEVQFFHVPVSARQPVPVSGATGVDPRSLLSWRAGREAAKHQVYVSTDANQVRNGTAPVNTVPGTSFDASAVLLLGQTYYWKVNEVNDAMKPAVWAGDVCSFSTAAALVVDDMESYNDAADKGTRIYETWADGFGTKTNGSQVGYDKASFAEQEIVHGGKQSMPLRYNNSTASSSEATRTFSSPQDWTLFGVKSLSLWFYGDPNGSGKLYLRINNTKVAYDGPAANITKPQWQVWNVDLSAVAGTLSKVTTLVIGVEGAGTSGILYIDDIRLYPKTPQFIVPVQPDKAGLIAYYPFDGNVKDSSGKGNDGTLVREPKWVPGKTGQAMDLDGMRDFVEVPDSASLDIADAITMAAWLNPRSTGDHRWVLAKSAWGATETYGLGVTNAGGIECGVSINNAWTFRQTAATIGNGTWSHVVGQYSPPFIRVFINGKLSQEWNVGTSKINTNSHNLFIGKQTGNQFYGGSIDDLRFYNRALSPEEILGLAGETAPAAKPFE